MDGQRAKKWWLLLPAGVRRLPADLAAVIAVVIVVNLAVFVPIVNNTPLRVVVGLPFVLFIPGYAFIAALFPEAGASPSTDTTEPAEPENTESQDESPAERQSFGSRGIDGIERVALSFGLSIAIVPLIGLVLNFTPWGIRLTPIMVATSGFTLGATWVGARRRWALPAQERFTVPYQSWIRDAREELLEPDSRADAVLNVLLVLSILLAVTSVTYAVAVPKQGESFTEFYLLTEDDSGQLVADDYPTEMTVGEGSEVVVGIGNHEFQRVNYTVVVELQRVQFRSTTNGTTAVVNATNQSRNITSVSVLEEEELRRFRTRLTHNQTWLDSYRIRPSLTGQRLRLAFLLYKDTPPSDPTVDNAYRETHLWVNVTRSSAG